jgi:hypothetical protein
VKMIKSLSTKLSLKLSHWREIRWVNLLIKEPITNGGFSSLTIVGVIKDFHFRSLHEPIAPLMMLNNPYGGLIIKTKTAEMADLIESIQAKWQAFDVEEPFTYALLDELIQRDLFG